MTKELTKEEETQSLQILERPDYITGGDSSKDMDLSAEDIKLSYLTVGQAMSNAVQDGTVKKGDFYDSVTRKNFGDSVEIIILNQSKVWKKFEKLKLSKTSTDGEFWGDGTKLSSDEKFLNLNVMFLVMVRGNLEPFPLSLGFKSKDKNNGYALGKLIKVNTADSKEMIFSRYYKLVSEEIDNPSGKSFIKCIAAKWGYISKKEHDYIERVHKEINILGINEDSYMNKKVEGAETDKMMDMICEAKDETDEITLN